MLISRINDSIFSLIIISNNPTFIHTHGVSDCAVSKYKQPLIYIYIRFKYLYCHWNYNVAPYGYTMAH
jgi:hypothetical protein